MFDWRQCKVCKNTYPHLPPFFNLTKDGKRLRKVCADCQHHFEKDREPELPPAGPVLKHWCLQPNIGNAP